MLLKAKKMRACLCSQAKKKGIAIFKMTIAIRANGNFVIKKKKKLEQTAS